MVLPQHQTIEYLPEVYVGTITKDGVFPHPEPADTRIKVFLVAEISPTKFFREAVYLPSHNHRRDFIDNMYRWTATTIYLVAEGGNNDDNIYCLAFGPPFNTPTLFGKLAQECELYRLCVVAFGEAFQNGQRRQN